MTAIERQVHIDASPMWVAAELTRSPWRAALSITPAGAGTQVHISADIEPEDLARSVELLALDEVCQLTSRLAEARGVSGGDSAPITAPRTTPSFVRKTTKRRITMTTISRQVTIDAPSDKVWPALADFGGISTWNPNVKVSNLTSVDQSGPGITRECQLIPMGTVQERVSEWVEGEMISVEIFEFKNVPAMRSAVAVFRLEPQGQRTIVHLEMTYEVGLGAVGAGMNSMVMKRQFAKAATGLMAGLKHHVETGDPVDRTSPLPTAAVIAA